MSPANDALELRIEYRLAWWWQPAAHMATIALYFMVRTGMLDGPSAGENVMRWLMLNAMRYRTKGGAWQRGPRPRLRFHWIGHWR